MAPVAPIKIAILSLIINHKGKKQITYNPFKLSMHRLKKCNPNVDE